MKKKSSISIVLVSVFLLSGIAVVAPVTMPSEADACSCLPPDVARSYHWATDVFQARVGNKLRGSPEGKVWYRARVLEDPFKGCLEKRDRVILQTNSHAAACGVKLDRRSHYLIYGTAVGLLNGRTPIYDIGACDYNRRWSELSMSDLTFLETRYNCCGDECLCTDGTEPFRCLIDPCSGEEPCQPDATCVANYCGGCNAEFYDPTGALVCTNECYFDDDCDGDSWCRQNSAEEGKCVLFAGPGDSCEGSVPPWMLERCEPGLICVPVEQTGDVPGTCATCNYNGVPYQAGERFPADDGCNTCICTKGGMINCTKMPCNPL